MQGQEDSDHDEVCLSRDDAWEHRNTVQQFIHKETR